jgi:hypothetical protein
VAITLLGESVRIRDEATEPNTFYAFPAPGVSISLTYNLDAPAGSRVILLMPVPNALSGTATTFSDSAGNVYTKVGGSGVLNHPLEDFGIALHECVLTNPIAIGDTVDLGPIVLGCNALVFSAPEGPAVPPYGGTFRALTNAEALAGATALVDAGSPGRERVLIGGALLKQAGVGVPQPAVSAFSTGWTALTQIADSEPISTIPSWRVFRPCYRIAPAGTYEISATFASTDYSLDPGRWTTTGDIFGIFWAPVGFNSWTARIVDPCTGLPAWGVAVRLLDQLLGYDVTKYADSNGRVTFGLLADGTYAYTIGPNFVPITRTPSGVIGTLTGSFTAGDGEDRDEGDLLLSRPSGCPPGVSFGVECASTGGTGTAAECARTAGVGTAQAGVN